MMLWTWQGFDFNPLTDRVDRSKSDHLSRPFGYLLRAYEELEERLALSAERKHQYVWCYTTDSWRQHPERGRGLWPLDVPQEKILAYVDGPSWECLIGNRPTVEL